MQLPVRAALTLQALTDAEQTAQDLVLSVTRRISSLAHSLPTAPASEHANTEAEIARLRDKQEAAQNKHKALADQNARLRHFLDTLGPAHLEDVKTKPPKIDKGDTLAQAVARIRLRIGALANERRKVDRCGLPIADAKQQAAEYVARLAERGKPKIVFGHGLEFRATFDAVIDDAWTTRLDIAAALAYVDPAALLQRLCEDIEAQPKPALALSAKARAEKLAAFDLELLTLEFEEEAIVATSEVDGPVLQRRADCDPRAVLGIVRRNEAKPEGKVQRVKADDAA